MKRMILVAAIAIGLVDASPVQAQFGPRPVAPRPYVGGFSYGGGATFAARGYGYRVSGFGGGYYSRLVFLTPPGFSASSFLPLGWGGGFGWGGWGPVVFAPPIIVVPPPIVLVGGNGPGIFPDDGVSRDDLPRPIDSGPLGAKPGDHLVIRPRKDRPPPGEIAPKIDRVAPGVRPRPPAFAFDPFAVRKLVNVDKADPDPVKEATRLVERGRLAFAAGEFGRAGEHFDRASTSDPKSALPHFLRAQAMFAAGRFAEAVAAIRAGLVLDPTWPAGTFDPKDLYGANPAVFDDHLADLKRAIAANPGEATLEFLLGYQLWFSGDKVEAKKLFAAAEKRIPAPGPIALFK